jgi:benzoate/toluate 1,2-dioxygenase subunit alpha
MNAYRLKDLIDDRPRDGVFRISRAMFSDPELFALEMQHIFERGWVFLGMASQVENPNDFLTAQIGRVISSPRRSAACR